MFTTPRNPLHPGLSALRPRLHTTAAVGAILVLAAVNAVLNALYARSKFPVPFATGQTTFDGPTLKSYYRVMLDAGTLDVYWATQLFDFVFIGAMAIAGLAVGSRLLRANQGHERLCTITGLATAAVVLGAGLDAVENLISFVMLARPESFADWIVYPYSTAAVAKFSAVSIGWVGLFGVFVITLGSAGYRLIRPASVADAC